MNLIVPLNSSWRQFLFDLIEERILSLFLKFFSRISMGLCIEINMYLLHNIL